MKKKFFPIMMAATLAFPFTTYANPSETTHNTVASTAAEEISSENIAASESFQTIYEPEEREDEILEYTIMDESTNIDEKFFDDDFDNQEIYTTDAVETDGEFLDDDNDNWAICTTEDNVDEELIGNEHDNWEICSIDAIGINVDDEPIGIDECVDEPVIGDENETPTICTLNVVDTEEKSFDNDHWDSYTAEDESAELFEESENIEETTETLAYEVIQGKWGNGQDRKKNLTVSGYDYDTIQSRVNEILE